MTCFVTLLLLIALSLPGSAQTSAASTPLGDIPLPGLSATLHRGISTEAARSALANLTNLALESRPNPETGAVESWLEGVAMVEPVPYALQAQFVADTLSGLYLTAQGGQLADWFADLKRRLAGPVRRGHHLIVGQESDFYWTSELELSVSAFDTMAEGGSVTYFGYDIDFYSADEILEQEAFFARPGTAVTVPGTASALRGGMTAGQIRAALAPFEVTGGESIVTLGELQAYQALITAGDVPYSLSLFLVDGKLWRFLISQTEAEATVTTWFNGLIEALPGAEQAHGVSDLSPDSDSWATEDAIYTAARVTDLQPGQTFYVHAVEFAGF